jgi:hypothetical protein
VGVYNSFFLVQVQVIQILLAQIIPSLAEVLAKQIKVEERTAILAHLLD